MIRRVIVSLSIAAVGALILANAVTAFSASNSVPSSRAGDVSQAISVNEVGPDECASITLENRISGSGTIQGTSGNDLIVGSDGPDTIEGMGGDDCIEGLGGDDTLDGGPGSDVCLSGAGADTFAACETEF